MEIPKIDMGHTTVYSGMNTLESTIEQAVTKLLIDPLKWTVM